MSKEELVAFLNDMVDALTWKRFALLTLLGLFTIGLLMVFESRTTIFNRFIDTTPVEELSAPWEISAQTKAELTALTKLPIIDGVLLTEVNLKKNRRIVKFWHVNDADFRQEATTIASSILPQAFFDTDKKNNEQMLAVLGNQFVCTPAVDTVYIRFFPNIDKKYPVICRLAVPPFAGEFAGLVTVFLKRKPTPSEVDSLKIEITRVSVEMYLRDIQGRGKKR